jgi:steroid 5-alpha reductase family enzyme
VCSSDLFFGAWTLQALWVIGTSGAALAAIATASTAPFGALGWVGLAVWTAGFALEVVADAQKRAFRRGRPAEHRFITTGLWAWSRHPNYFGEIVLWIGVAVMAAPALSGLQLLTLGSPVVVWVLLTQVSGIPLLERSATQRWGHDPGWQAYCERTPRLIPRPPKRPA